jgi:two-component system LytT family sensor kinase
MPEEYLVPLLVKIGIVAALASILVRSSAVKKMLLRETRTMYQRLQLALWFAVVFGAGVATRAITDGYRAVDLGLEGSLLAGIMGGYFTGLISGVLISLPAFFSQEYASMPLFAGLGVLGGLLRDLASDPEDIWSFSPFLDLNVYHLLRGKRDRRRNLFHILLFAGIIFAEFLRQMAVMALGPGVLFHMSVPAGAPWPAILGLYVTTLFSVTLPLKIWNNTRNEVKLEEQRRSLIEARLDALTRQINPHFLFNTLNSVSALIRTDPQQARAMVTRLSSILRRLLRRTDNFTPLRDELGFIQDYLSIEMVRFGEKLRFISDVAPDTMDMQLPSMLLQPLIENCIKHGLSSKLEGGTITLRTKRGPGRLLIAVEDDGVGIPEEQLATMLDRGVGVNNVNERLKVLFGSNYQMRIDSKPGAGTRIELDVPELQAAASKDLAAVS